MLLNDVRNTVYKNKKKLKGKRFLITQSLTATNVGLLKEAQGKYGIRNVWTINDQEKKKKATDYYFAKNKITQGLI